MRQFSLENFMEKPEKKVAKRVIYNDENTLAFILNIAPGESLPKHTHFDCTVLLQVMKGQADVIVDGEPVAVEENDLLKIDGPEEISVDNTAQDTLVLYVTISPLPPADKYKVDADF